MTYPPGMQTKAIRMCRQLGVREASRQLDIDVATLSRWMATAPAATAEARMALAVADSVEDARRRQLLEEAQVVTEKAVRAASLFLDSAMAAAVAKEALSWTTAAEKLISVVSSVGQSHQPAQRSWRDELREPDVAPVEAEIVDYEDVFE